LRYTSPSSAAYIPSSICPLGYYSGFVLPHRFGQSNQSLKDWVTDQLKGLAIGVPLGLLMLELLYLALRLTGDLWWLWAAGGLLLFNVVLSNLAPVLIMPLFNKYVPLGDEHKDLEERLLDLAKRANTKVKGVFKFDMSKRTKAANAALTGSATRAVSSWAIRSSTSSQRMRSRRCSRTNLGHHVHKDIPCSDRLRHASDDPRLVHCISGIGLRCEYLLLRLRRGHCRLPRIDADHGRVYGLLTSPSRTPSRWRENMADDYALQSTGKDEAFASGVYPTCQSKPRRDRPREMGGLHVLLPPAAGREN
jgi:STE24 endopeptidase